MLPPVQLHHQEVASQHRAAIACRFRNISADLSSMLMLLLLLSLDVF